MSSTNPMQKYYIRNSLKHEIVLLIFQKHVSSLFKKIFNNLENQLSTRHFFFRKSVVFHDTFFIKADN